ncbi:D-glycerate dehydrogenase [candidate division WOR-3 bacterium]|nr:D-glycerate dehydrogenase [candidate division WOR-3 bacterium]
MRVYATRELPGALFEKLKREHTVSVNPADLPPIKEELLKEVKEKEGLISLLTDKITREIIDSGSSLKIIANYAVGYDNIDVDYATRKGIMVTNTPDVLTNATTEITWALILGVARKIVEADKYTRDGKFKIWSPKLFVGKELHGSTLGIVGTGKIGTEVGKRGIGFGMHILYTDLKENIVLEQLGAEKVSLKELLKRADFVSIHTPLTDKTYKLIGKEELRLMKKDAILVNTSRGKVIDELALIETLKKGDLAGAGFDVYENEPEVPDKLKELPNVILLPHIGSATQVARENMARLAVQNLLIALSGEAPPNLVNPEVLK